MDRPDRFLTQSPGCLEGNPASEEDGAVAIISAITLTLMLLMAAFVIDLGFLRADRVESKSISDMAAAAAVVDYSDGEPGAALGACEEAIAFASANLGATAVPVHSCLAIYDSYVCDSDVAPDPPATYMIGDRTIEVFIPVPTDHPLMEGLIHAESYDGRGCERVGVRAERDRSFLLAGIAGFDGRATTQGSVGRAMFSGRLDEYASLIVLQRQGCQTLVNAGNAVLEVLNLVRWELNGAPVPAGTPGAEEVTYPGSITVDTLPSGCSGMQKIIQSAGTSTTHAEGDIFAHALVSADPDPGNANTYRLAHVNSGNLTQPVAGPMITRALIDHRFNCLPGGYDDASPLWSPLRGSQPIDPCTPTDASGTPIPPPPPYLKNLDDEVAAVMGGTTAGWSIFPTDHPAPNCSASGQVVTGGRWIVDCPTSFGPDDLTFQDAEHIIFVNGLAIGTNDELRIYGDPSAGTTVTMFQNGLDQNGGLLELQNVFTYIRNADTTGSSGRFRIGGSTERFAAQAPLDDSDCATYGGTGMPPAACFAPLAVWSNFVGTGGGNSVNLVNGAAAGGVIGTIFSPNATFDFAGSGDISGQFCGAPSWNLIANTAATLQLVGAQFFANRISLPSGAAVGMCPSPETTVGIPIRGSGLIR